MDEYKLGTKVKKALYKENFREELYLLINHLGICINDVDECKTKRDDCEITNELLAIYIVGAKRVLKHPNTIIVYDISEFLSYIITKTSFGKKMLGHYIMADVLLQNIETEDEKGTAVYFISKFLCKEIFVAKEWDKFIKVCVICGEKSIYLCQRLVDMIHKDDIQKFSTSLEYAWRNENKHIFDSLYKKGVRLKVSPYLIEKPSIESIIILKETHPSFFSEKFNDNQMLHNAICNGRLDIVLFLYRKITEESINVYKASTQDKIILGDKIIFSKNINLIIWAMEEKLLPSYEEQINFDDQDNYFVQLISENMIKMAKKLYIFTDRDNSFGSAIKFDDNDKDNALKCACGVYDFIFCKESIEWLLSLDVNKNIDCLFFGINMSEEEDFGSWMLDKGWVVDSNYLFDKAIEMNYENVYTWLKNRGYEPSEENIGNMYRAHKDGKIDWNLDYFDALYGIINYE